MAMYDLEDVGEADLKRSETTAETLVKGKRIDKLITEDCRAGFPAAENPVEPQRWWMKTFKWIADHAMQIAIPVITALILAFLNLS